MSLNNMTTVFIMMSNSRSIIGVWDEEPPMEERRKAYSKFLEKSIDANSVDWNTWTEEHEVKTVKEI